MNKAFLLIPLSVLFLQSCAFAPFSNGYSARTTGKDRWALQGGVSANGQIPFVRIYHGFSENFDLGLILEEQFGDSLVGGFAKYAFVNEQTGVSFSIEGSTGGTYHSYYFYAGPTIGYKFTWWEPYLTARYNYVNYRYKTSFDLGIFGEQTLEGKNDFHYGYLTFGNTFWLTQSLGLNLNANYVGGDLNDVFLGAAVVLKL